MSQTTLNIWYFPFFLFCYALVINFSLTAEQVLQKTGYPQFSQYTAEHDEMLADFRRSPLFRQTHDISYEFGLQYLNIILSEYPEMSDYFSKFRARDVGNPIDYNYGVAGRFSPLLLRYIKAAAEIKHRFGDLSQKHIVEIGSCCGLQCMILEDIGGFASYTIVDLPECNELTKKFIAQQGIENVYFVDMDQLAEIPACDLVISHYKFAEMDQWDQRQCIELLIQSASYGYIAMNFISQHLNISSLPIEDLIRALYESSNSRKGIVEKERPATDPNNILLTWQPVSARQVKGKTSKIRLIPSKRLQRGNAISYSFSGGRFGDNLIAYFHAKWMAYKTGLPFLYVPFLYSENLNLDILDQPLNDSFRFKNSLAMKKNSSFNFTEAQSSLFIIPYFPECKFELEMHSFLRELPSFDVDWDDPEFHREVVECLTPKRSIKTLELPKDKVTVGVHVRRGGGVDMNQPDLYFPLKFPPDSYYIQQIARIAKIFDKKKLYVFILTDDLNPEQIVNKYRQALNNPNIEFSCRAQNNSPFHNVLEDFFSIPKFDCLIFCQSNFSIVASKMSNYAIDITPYHCIANGTGFTIDDIELRFNSSKKE